MFPYNLRQTSAIFSRMTVEAFSKFITGSTTSCQGRQTDARWVTGLGESDLGRCAANLRRSPLAAYVTVRRPVEPQHGLRRGRVRKVDSRSNSSEAARANGAVTKVMAKSPTIDQFSNYGSSASTVIVPRKIWPATEFPQAGDSGPHQKTA